VRNKWEFFVWSISHHLHFHICLLLLLLILLFLLILLNLFHVSDAPLLLPIQRWILTTGMSHLTLHSNISCTWCHHSCSKTSIPYWGCISYVSDFSHKGYIIVYPACHISCISQNLSEVPSSIFIADTINFSKMCSIYWT